MKQELNITI